MPPAAGRMQRHRNGRAGVRTKGALPPCGQRADGLGGSRPGSALGRAVTHCCSRGYAEAMGESPMAKTEAERRLSELTDVGLVQRCEAIAGSLNFLLVGLNRIDTDPRSADFVKPDYDSAHRRVKAALQDLTFELAPPVLNGRAPLSSKASETPNPLRNRLSMQWIERGNSPLSNPDLDGMAA